MTAAQGAAFTLGLLVAVLSGHENLWGFAAGLALTVVAGLWPSKREVRHHV